MRIRSQNPSQNTSCVVLAISIVGQVLLTAAAAMGPAGNGTSSGNGASAHLQRLEEAERRKREMEQKRAAAAAVGLPPSRSMSSASAGNASGNRGGRGSAAAAGGRSSRERSQRRNGTYVLLLVTTLTATIGLNVAHHAVTGGGTAQVSVRAAEAFLAKHFNTAMDVLETEVHQLENHLGHVWHGDDDDNGKETAYDKAVRRGDGEDDEDAAGGMKPWLNKGGDRRVEVGDDVNAKDEIRETASNHIGGGHTLGGLSCAKHGGPSDEIAAEMVYWSDIPSDSQFVSPFKKEGETKYMTFEPDGGGWNNIRMAMETVVALAHATGRTLVMPPEQRMYLLGKGDKEHKKHFGFGDFYHLESLSDEHKGLDIVSMEDFLEREAMTGNLKNRTTGVAMYPPGNRTNWDGENNKEISSLKEYLREVTLTPLWKPDKCLAAFPSAPGPEIENLHKMRANIMAEHGRKELENQDQSAPNVLGTAQDRMQQNLLGRDLCIYDEEMQEAPVIHFMCYHKMRVRLLVHFYAFLYFESALQDLWTKRFIRDHLRYKDEMQCAAARAVNFIRERARARDPKGNPDGLFDSVHIRRGDFQYKRTRVDADVLYKESMNELTENATVFVATDERDRAFFQPLRDHYDLIFLDDVMHLFEGMNPNNFGMLDQLIASKGRIFYGTFHSTFTGWINRMRGYYIDKHQLDGSTDGSMDSYYFVPEDKKMCMKSYSHIHFPFFAREYPTAWYNLDKGVEQLAAEVQGKAITTEKA